MEWRIRSDGLCAAVYAHSRGMKKRGVVLSCDGAPRSRTDFAWACVEADIMEASFGWIARGCLCAWSRHEKSGALCYRVKARRAAGLTSHGRGGDGYGMEISFGRIVRVVTA